MAEFRAINPDGKTVATRDLDSAEAAHAWFLSTIPDHGEPGWRMEVNDDGRWAYFDDTAGFTAPTSRRPATR
ncbi:MAG: hypothetical protein JO236_04110 [Mycobacterium sp.]|uniref:hypothetical protein n=1 Tax=Mycobacterium sp. TaxID=1785 RepID=UPI001EB424E4|nr:hypothetical protein [Mycobacterium sp.]MBW0016718.1 hypothetical protein [Mycobacterium sp.]